MMHVVRGPIRQEFGLAWTNHHSGASGYAYLTQTQLKCQRHHLGVLQDPPFGTNGTTQGIQRIHRLGRAASPLLSEPVTTFVAYTAGRCTPSSAQTLLTAHDPGVLPTERFTAKHDAATVH